MWQKKWEIGYAVWSSRKFYHSISDWEWERSYYMNLSKRNFQVNFIIKLLQRKLHISIIYETAMAMSFFESTKQCLFMFQDVTCNKIMFPKLKWAGLFFFLRPWTLVVQQLVIQSELNVSLTVTVMALGNVVQNHQLRKTNFHF